MKWRNLSKFASLPTSDQLVVSAIQSKNAVCAFIKHYRYFYSTYNFTLINSLAKKLYLHGYSTVETLFRCTSLHTVL